MNAMPYAHPSNSHYRLWDLPGHGTANFADPKAYVRDFGIRWMSVLLVVGTNRVRAEDMNLIKVAQTFGIPVFYVRNKMLHDVEDEMENHPHQSPTAAAAFEVIVQGTMSGLTPPGAGEALLQRAYVYFIDTRHQDQFDFRRLEASISNCLQTQARMLRAAA